jgi:serine/threonine protein kinase
MDSSAKYKLLEQVGNGSFGVVYKAVNKDTGEVVAIKEVCNIEMGMLTRRLILKVAMMILPRFNKKLQF